MLTLPDIGKQITLQVKSKRPEGWLLKAGNRVVVLPHDEAPQGLQEGDLLAVVLYLNQQGELSVSSKKPLAEVGQNAFLKVLASNESGAFLNWGLPKDLFLPRSKQLRMPEVGEEVFVKVFWDTYSERIACSQLPEDLYSNEQLDLKEKQAVELELLKDTPMAYQMIIDGKYVGLLYHNEVFKPIKPGEKLLGYVKRIKENNLVDLGLGKPGHARVEDESSRFLRRLKEEGGFMPYHDKTPPEIIYTEFQMSKKAFKMLLGKLYREKKILLTDEGVQLVPRSNAH